MTAEPRRSLYSELAELVLPGPFYCPSCGRTAESTLQTVNAQPACPSCGAWPLEPQGTGDDDPEAAAAVAPEAGS